MDETHLVLRLNEAVERDLVNRLGQPTVQLHQDVAARYGYVWWAKFRVGAKASLAAASIKRLRDQIAAGATTYAYIASPDGHWRARVTQIEDRDYPTPREAVPDYYSTISDLMVDLWFRMSDITALEPGYIEQNLVYASGLREGQPMDFVGQTSVRLGKAASDSTRTKVKSIRRRPVERASDEGYIVRTNVEVREAHRTESQLVERFAEHLDRLGHTVCGHDYPNNTKCDLVDETSATLVEAKSTANREDVRMAIGQLADYGRFEPELRRSILLPRRPTDDIRELIHSTLTDLIYETDEGFLTESHD